MTRRPALLAAAVAAAALAAAPLAAQSAPAPTSLWVGAGADLPLAQPGADRATGGGVVVGLDVPLVARVSVRLEVGAGAQSLRTRAGGPLTGDHQQVRTLATVRVAPGTVAGVAPYLLAGGGAVWRSDRLTLRNLNDPVPDAAYRETTSRAARGALLGAGASAVVAGVQLFGEARWLRVGAPAGHTTDLGVVAGVALPIVR